MRDSERERRERERERERIDLPSIFFKERREGEREGGGEREEERALASPFSRVLKQIYPCDLQDP